MLVAPELVYSERPLFINVPASLLLQKGTDADLRLRLFIISNQELLHPNPSQSDVGWLVQKTSRGGGRSCSCSNGEGTDWGGGGEGSLAGLILLVLLGLAITWQWPWLNTHLVNLSSLSCNDGQFFFKIILILQLTCDCRFK